jgi:hypothetical protein
MKRVFFLIAMLLFFVAPPMVSAQTPIATAADSVRWDYEDAQLTAAVVVRFELCYDAQTGAACTNVTPAATRFTPTTAQGGAPAAGFSAYKQLVGAMTPGNHTVNVRACSASICSAPLALTFQFAIVPPAPTNGQFIKGS